MTLIAPSILAADFRSLEREFDRIHTSDVEWIHFDMMDGVFVPNISFGFPILKAVRSLTTRHIDVHLMLIEPHRYIDACIESGADSISFHIEAASPIRETLEQIRQSGKKAGLVLNPDTPVEVIIPYVSIIDFVLIMSVYPGFWGQGFIEETYDRIQQAKNIREQYNANFLIEVDGGISIDNSERLIESGADILVSGSALFRSADFAGYVKKLRNTK